MRHSLRFFKTIKLMLHIFHRSDEFIVNHCPVTEYDGYGCSNTTDRQSCKPGESLTNIAASCTRCAKPHDEAACKDCQHFLRRRDFPLDIPHNFGTAIGADRHTYVEN